MNPFAIGAVVSYQGRCWIVSRTMGTWLHLVTATSPNHYHAIDIPRNSVSTELTATESSRKEMYCPFTKKS